MPTTCRLIQLKPEQAERLSADPGSLTATVQSASSYSGVYRYWHGIAYLLAQHRPGGAASRWLTIGAPMSAASAEVPGARLLSVPQVKEVDAELRQIQPDDLIPHYDAAALDAAEVYPVTWCEWEETFDPLGQMLE